MNALLLHETADEIPQPETGDSLESIFGPPIFTYTRRQAIEDGVLVDLMQPELIGLVKEAGFKYELAMTIGAFSETVCEVGQPLPPGQDINGRLWDVLWLAKAAIRRSKEGDDRVRFQVRVWNGSCLEIVKLWAHIGPGDKGEPVITIMLQHED